MEYKYYRLIFGNIYLVNKIYSYIRGTGYQYENIDISIITNSKNIELLKDKLKVGLPFKNLTTEKIHRFINKIYKNENYTSKEIDEMFIKFYEINKSLTPDGFGAYYDTTILLIKSNCMVLLKLYIGDILKDDLLKKETFKIQNRVNYYQTALINGHIEILEFIHGVFKLDINKIKEPLYWALISSNRDKMVDYLLNVMGYIVPMGFGNVITTSFYDNLKKLDFNLLKVILDTNQLYNEANEYSFSNIANYTKSTISNITPLDYISSYSSTCYLPVKKVIDFIQSSIYISKNTEKLYTKNQILKFDDYFNIIQLLIEYDSSTTGSIGIKNEIIKIQSKLSKKSSNNKSNTSQYSNINFNQFNLEREIRRIYIFEFLKDNRKHLNLMEDYSKFIIQFISVFKEYQLINYLKELVDIKEEFNQKLVGKIINVSFENADSNLLSIINENDGYYKSGIQFNNGSKHINYITILFNCDSIPVSNQIEFLSTVNSVLPIKFELLLIHIFNNNVNNQNLSIVILDQITIIIENYYNKMKLKSENLILLDSNECLFENLHVANYYFNVCKKPQLFSASQEINILNNKKK